MSMPGTAHFYLKGKLVYSSPCNKGFVGNNSIEQMLSNMKEIDQEIKNSPIWLKNVLRSDKQFPSYPECEWDEVEMFKERKFKKDLKDY